MSIQAALASLNLQQHARRTVAWAGGLFICIIVATAAYDIVRGYYKAVEVTGRELDAQSRVIAEQTTRSIQAVDVVLKHLVEQLQSGTLKNASRDELHLYLKEQAVGLVQADGLVVFNDDGSVHAVSQVPPAYLPKLSVAGEEPFERMRNSEGLVIDNTRISAGTKRRVFPLARRLATPTGEFAGVVGAPGQVVYFEHFYRDTYPDPSTRIALLHRDGWLLARHPHADAMLGKRLPILDSLLPSHVDAPATVTRIPSPVDHLDHFVAVRLVPDYPLAIAVSRDASAALASWRAQSIGAALRMGALSVLAAVLLALLLKQLSRLGQSEERFALAVAGSNDGIVDWDLVNDRMYASEQAMEILGINSKVTLRPRAEWSAMITYHPDDAQRMKEDLRNFLAGHTELHDGEYRVLQPNGEYRWIRHRNKCVRDSIGRPLRVAGSVSDIDPQKRSERERLRLEGQLLQAKKLEAIGTLAGGIAHDFNNILAAILGYGEMAQKEAVEGTPLKRHIDAVVGAGLRAKSLVERILAFSRSGVGERKPVHVQSVVVEALDLVLASLPESVRLERQLDAGDTAVLGDPTQFHQVVMNLCANGAQAMKSGGTLSVMLDVIDKRESMAATSELAAGRYVRLIVSDTGTGIASNMLERIFDPFFTTKEIGVGTGLGLSLVHGIVTDLGGGIDVDSEVGKGSTFTVYIPATGSIRQGASGDELLEHGNGETILLVDDEDVLVRLGEEMIAGLEYEPIGFTSSVAALQAFRATPDRFSVVLTDEAMSEMAGSEMAREIRAIRPEIPVLIMSGFVSPALLSRAREMGNMDVLAKPVVEQDLARGLANAIRRNNRVVP